LRREKDEQKDRVDQLIDLLLKQQAESSKQQVESSKQLAQRDEQLDHLLKQQALLLSQIEKGSNASSKLQSSEASRLLQVFEDQSLLQQSNPDSTSLVGKNDSQSSLAGSSTPNTSLSHGPERGAFKQPKKRRTAG
jgi:hypothetical protein